MENKIKNYGYGQRKLSLKWKFIAIIGLCWIIPVMLVVGLSGYFILNTIDQQLINTAVMAVENAVKSGMYGIDSVIAASREASYNPAVRSAYMQFQRDGDRMALYDKVTSFLRQQYKYDSNIESAVLYFYNDPETLYYTFRSTYISDYRSEVHQKAIEASQGLDTGISYLSIDGRVYVVRNILNSDFEPYAVIVLEMNLPVVFNSLQNLVWETDAAIRLNSEEVLLKGEKRTVLWDTFTVNSSQTQRLADVNNTLFYGWRQQDGYRFEYAVWMDTVSLMKEVSKFKMVFVSVVVFLIPLLLLVIRFFYVNISDPVGRLVKASNQIEEGQFGIQIEAASSNQEFQYLFQAFNSMSQRLWYQFERLYREELALRDAKIRALQSQINPHFMNNTLEIINWEARLAGNVKVSEMIESLSIMLDAAMDRKGKPLVHLSEEMMYVNAYLHIINERLGKRLTVEKQIDETLLDEMVPRLILQPIIENAVEHGIQPRQKGTIVIRVYADTDADSALVLEIINDSPLSEEDEQHIETLLSDSYDPSEEGSANLGIRNVHQRVRMIYGQASGLSIKTDNNGHTVSKIVLQRGQDGSSCYPKSQNEQ